MQILVGFEAAIFRLPSQICKPLSEANNAVIYLFFSLDSQSSGIRAGEHSGSTFTVPASLELCEGGHSVHGGEVT